MTGFLKYMYKYFYQYLSPLVLADIFPSDLTGTYSALVKYSHDVKYTFILNASHLYTKRNNIFMSNWKNLIADKLLYNLSNCSSSLVGNFKKAWIKWIWNIISYQRYKTDQLIIYQIQMFLCFLSRYNMINWNYLSAANDFSYLQRCAEAILTSLYQSLLPVHRVIGQFRGHSLLILPLVLYIKPPSY